VLILVMPFSKAIARLAILFMNVGAASGNSLGSRRLLKSLPVLFHQLMPSWSRVEGFLMTSTQSKLDQYCACLLLQVAEAAAQPFLVKGLDHFKILSSSAYSAKPVATVRG
jgi:hypothetical protein